MATAISEYVVIVILHRLFHVVGLFFSVQGFLFYKINHVPINYI